jgi:TonB family protein
METAAHSSVRIAGVLGASILLHAGFIALIGKGARLASAPAQIPLEVAVVEMPRAPRPPSEPVPMKLARAPRVAPRDVPPPAARQRTSALPPPPSREARQQQQQPIVLPGVTLESTSEGSTFAMSAGNTLHGQPPETAARPTDAKPYRADRYVAASQVNELPTVEWRPDSLEPFYPEEARQRRIEGDVKLRLLIDADGSLAKVEVIVDPGSGLGAAGARAIRQFRFGPGKVNGQPVATTITYTLQFVLN